MLHCILVGAVMLIVTVDRTDTTVPELAQGALVHRMREGETA